MNPQPRTNDSQDARNERLTNALTAGEYTDAFTDGLCPMHLEGNFLVPDQDYLDAETRRIERRRNGC